MKRKLKIFIIAGEVSGDVLGGKIMAEMPDVEFIGVGGENMKARGLDSIFPMPDIAVMGFIDVIARGRTITRRINQTANTIIKESPDIVLTIDSPGFVRRVIEKVKRQSPAADRRPLFYHVVAPQVWAWAAGRAKKYARVFDRLYAFFDFEVPYFAKHGLPTIPVGHPIADGLIGKKHKVEGKGAKVITLLPGSRMGEVRTLLPIFKKVTEQLPEYKFVLPVVETTAEYVREHVKKWTVKPTVIPAAKRYDQFAKTDIAIAAVGTVSAELAMMHVPTIAVFRVNRITEFMARRVLKLKWLSLVNILSGREVYPEILGRACTPENITGWVRKLEKPAERKKMVSGLARADKMWQRRIPAAKLIAKDITTSNRC
ncbi:MAG: lipid-A-disaccharide synthase [Alphaproteobacteria bacterium]|nr:lipid-A-disaccharide synthase [Alphaproteobacteria bacterium]